MNLLAVTWGTNSGKVYSFSLINLILKNLSQICCHKVNKNKQYIMLVKTMETVHTSSAEFILLCCNFCDCCSVNPSENMKIFLLV